jgi:hypothetical protein
MRSRRLLLTAGLGLLSLGLVLGAVLFAADDDSGPVTQATQISLSVPHTTAQSAGYAAQPVLAGILHDGRPWALRLDPDFGLCPIIGSTDFGCDVPNNDPPDRATPRRAVERTAFATPQSGVLAYAFLPSGATQAQLVFVDGRTVNADEVVELTAHFWAAPMTPGDNPLTVIYRDDNGTEVSRYQIG